MGPREPLWMVPESLVGSYLDSFATVKTSPVDMKTPQWGISTCRFPLLTSKFVVHSWPSCIPEAMANNVVAMATPGTPVVSLLWTLLCTVSSGLLKDPGSYISGRPLYLFVSVLWLSLIKQCTVLASSFESSLSCRTDDLVGFASCCCGAILGPKDLNLSSVSSTSCMVALALVPLSLGRHPFVVVRPWVFDPSGGGFGPSHNDHL